MINKIFIYFVCAIFYATISGCGRPDFETFETRISTTLNTERGLMEYSANVTIYVNNIDGTVNYKLEEFYPPWTPQCKDCKDALLERAKEITLQKFPHLNTY